MLMTKYSTFVCSDNKHGIKIWEPDAPVASAECGRQVIVHSGTSLQAADHDLALYHP